MFVISVCKDNIYISIMQIFCEKKHIYKLLFNIQKHNVYVILYLFTIP